MLIKVEVDAGIAPVHVALLRCAFGCAALFPILWLTRDRLPPRDALRPLLVMAVLSTSLVLTLVFSLALLPEERPTRRRLAGIAIGFAGVVVVLGPWEGLGSGSLIGAGACLAAATPGVEVWLSVVALGALGTGIAYVLMFNIVQQAGAQTGSMITYLVGVALSR